MPDLAPFLVTVPNAFWLKDFILEQSLIGHSTIYYLKMNPPIVLPDFIIF